VAIQSLYTQLAGATASYNLDGGMAASVYTPGQFIDGGGA
jgi:exopolysaccharide biosynthesis protein